MSIQERAKALRARYNDDDLRRIKMKAEADGFPVLLSAATLALLIIA